MAEAPDDMSRQQAEGGHIPTLRELDQLPVATVWYRLGLQLGIRAEDLDVIEKDYPRETDMCKVKMFGKWLRSDTNPNYEKLIKALAAVKKRKLAESVCDVQGISRSVLDAVDAVQLHQSSALDTTHALRSLSLPQPPECIAKYSRYLKNKYKQMSVLPVWDWPPSIGRQYTELSLIERNKRLSTADEDMEMEDLTLRGKINEIVDTRKEWVIELADLFAPEVMDGPTKILMDGTPGIGKTTITRKICKDWGNDKLLQQYHLVVLLELRNQTKSPAKSIVEFADLFPTNSQDLKQQVIKHIEETSGERLLLIFDGYDELDNKNRMPKSIFFKIIQGEELHNCSVLVTSRPYASDDLQSLNSISRHVEVIGFTEKQIQLCIQQSVPSEVDAKEFVRTLKGRMDIISLCYTPLHCAIMLHVYQQKSHTLPNTLTELFAAFILNALTWNATKQIDQDELRKTLRRTATLDKLPDPVKSQFKVLCKIAYESFMVHKVVFSYDDLKSAFPHCKQESELESNLLSLMTATTSFTGSVKYQFLHLNIHEFLAAKWCAITQSANHQAQFIRDYLKHTQYRNVLKFLAGISQLNGTISDVVFPESQSLIPFRDPYHLQFYTYHHQELQDTSFPRSTTHAMYTASPFHVSAIYYSPAHFAIRQASHSTISEYLAASHIRTDRRKTRAKYTSNNTFRRFLLLAQLIRESQNLTMYPRLLHLLDNQKELSVCFYRLLPAECVALAHFLTRIKHTWKVLGFHFCGLTDHSLDIFQKVSSENYSGSQCKEVQFSYNAPSFIKNLSLLPQVMWFRNTEIVGIEGLQYPDGVSTKEIELHKIFSMKCLTDLTISVQSIPTHHLSDYLYTFSQFTDALKSNKILKRLSYEHPRNSDCSVFEYTAAALKHNFSLHLSSQFKFRKGYPCELPMTVQSLKMCKTVVFYLFQLPCIKHVKQVAVKHKTFLSTCDNPTCCSVSREGALQAFENFLVATVSEIDLFHSDSSNPAEYSAEVAKSYSIRQLFSDGSDSTFSCTVNVMGSSASFHVTNLVAKLSLLPRIALFNNTTTLNIHNLNYPEGVSANQIELHRVLDMNCLANLNISVKSVACQQLNGYLSIFTKFTNALKRNENLKWLLYEHPHSSNCSIFECTAKALKQDSSLHLSNQFKIQKGYPCELAMTVQSLRICKTVAFYLFQLPCIKHVKQVAVEHETFLRTCDNPTCCSISREEALQAFESFLVTCTHVSEIDLFHRDRSNLAEYSTEVAKSYSIRQLLSDGSDSTFSCTVNVMESSASFHVTSLIAKLSLLSRIALFNNTTTLNIHNLNYPEGVSAKQIELHRVLDMRCLTDLRISVESVPDHHRDDYLSMFTQFTHVLRTSESIEKLLYEHPHSSNCSIFECTATALKQNPLLHLASRYMIQMGYPCQLSGSELHWDVHSIIINDVTQQIDGKHRHNIMCPTITVCFLQVPCIDHMTELDFRNTVFKSCHLCSTSKDSVIQALKTFLKTSNIISELNLSHCGLTDENAELIAAGLAENKSVQNINVSGNELSAKAMLMVLKSNSAISYKNICDQIGSPDSIMGGVQTLSHILSESVTMIATNTTLTLSIPGVNRMKIIRTGIQNLTISLEDPAANELIAKGWEFLFKILNQSASMKVRLSLMNNLQSVSSGLTSSAAISIFTLLEHNTSLEELDLSRNKQLAKGDSEAVGYALERMLVRNAGISVLMLKLCAIDDHIGEKIGMGLAENKAVRVLNVSTNNIHSGGAVSIFTALEHNTSLEKLDLSRNKELTDGNAEAVGHSIKKMLTVNKGLHTLNLQQCGICDQIGKQIGVGLTGNMSLRVLNISHGSIHSGGAVSIFTSLEHNSSLEELDLSWNKQLTDGNTEAVGHSIKKMLTVNKGLHTLNLQQCGICDPIGKQIGVGLTGNMSLRVLNISHGSIHSGGAVSIFTSLEHNNSLEKLDLSWNWYLTKDDSEAVSCVIERMLTVNKRIQTLKLQQCGLCDQIGDCKQVPESTEY